MGNRGSILHENRTICIGGGQDTKSGSSLRPENGTEGDVEIKPSKPRVFCDNRVVSYKYTIWSFLPRNLFEQFRRIANFYFLCITIIQLTIDSPVSATTSILPLAFVISVTAVKQGYEDWLRHRADAKVNKAPTTIIDAKGNKKAVECSHLMVGDIVRVEDGEDLPCDLILLASSRKDGRAHVTTANLDGETNLKTLQCPRPLRYLISPDIEPELANLKVKIICEEPTPDLYNFSGTLELFNEQKSTKNGSDTVLSGTREEKRNSHKLSLKSKIKCEPKVSLSIDNLLLRGARLKNTDFVYGCAVYTGQETKLSLNSKLTRNKFSSVEKAVNGFLFFFLVIMVIEVMVSIALKLVTEQSYTSVNTVFREPKRKITTGSVVQDVFSFIILYNYLIPISLYVTIELQKFLGTFFFMWDSDMYCEKTKQAAVCNTSDLNEELGQVQYLFTDKTGTLTENLMEFQRCSINTMVFVENNGQLKKLLPDGREENGVEITNLTPEIEEFFTALALCHTAQVEKWKLPGSPGNSIQTRNKILYFDGSSLESLETVEEEDDEDMTMRDPMKLNYQASSPDEKALLEAIRRCGVAYLGEKDDILYVKVKNKVRMFLRLDVLEFSSERARMSIAVEEIFNDERSVNYENNPVIVYCKGAETVLEKLSVRGPKQDTINHIDDFAKRGLRTLMVGHRYLSKKEFSTLSAAIQADRLHQAVAGSKRMSVVGSIRGLPATNGLQHGHKRNYSAGGVIEAASARTSSLNRNREEFPTVNKNSHDVHFMTNPSFVGDNGVSSDCSPRGAVSANGNSFHFPSSPGFPKNSLPQVENHSSAQVDNVSKNGFHSDVCGKLSCFAMSEMTKSGCECERDKVSVRDVNTNCVCMHASNFAEADKSLQERKASLDSAIKCNTSTRKREMMHHLRSKSSSDYRHFYGAKHDAMVDIGHRPGHMRDRSVSGSILRRLLSRQNSLLSSLSSDSIKSFPMIRRDSGLKDSDALLALESGLTVLGATAVRDQLQEKVPETLESLRAAGIKVWILTGDKLETAVNVSFSCGHFKIGTEQLFLTGHTKYESCFQTLKNLSERIASDREKQYGLVIDGVSLHQIFYDGNGVDPKIAVDLFLAISSSCNAVVCCRMSPLQKCKVVHLVKSLPLKPITAAIGDGANDVSMIQEAHVGIGIMGKEGRQAARSSDFALARFHFLRKALLVHGHWYYVRLATLIQYFFYKNIVFNTPQVCYGAHSLFSTQTLYDGLYLTTYNVLMTSLPITLFGLFEQNFSSKLLMKYPQMYLINRGNALMLWKKFFQWLIVGLWHSLALYFAVWAIWSSSGSITTNGGPADLLSFGTTVFHIVVVVVNLKLWLESKFWTSIFIFSIFISIFGNMLLTYIYSIMSVEFDMYGVYLELLESPSFWLLSTVISVACLIPDIVIMVVKNPVLSMWERYKKKRQTSIHHEVAYFWKKNSGSLTISNTRLAEQDALS